VLELYFFYNQGVSEEHEYIFLQQEHIISTHGAYILTKFIINYENMYTCSFFTPTIYKILCLNLLYFRCNKKGKISNKFCKTHILEKNKARNCFL
jgi:hypothetical protein